MSFTVVYLFSLQNLESHITKKSSSQPAPIATLILSWALHAGLSDHLDPKDSKTCLNSLLHCCCILEKELLLLSNKNFPGCSH